MFTAKTFQTNANADKDQAERDEMARKQSLENYQMNLKRKAAKKLDPDELPPGRSLSQTD